MQARMKNPAMILGDALPPLQTLVKIAEQGGVPKRTLNLLHMRASQINGCSFCLDMHVRQDKETAETPERTYAVAAWRHTTYFDAAERAALALTEAVTRLSDREDAVPDAVWDEAARHYDEKGLAAIVLWIATVNAFNRLNVAVRQIPGSVKW